MDRATKLQNEVRSLLNDAGFERWLCIAYGRMLDRMTERDINILTLESFELRTHYRFLKTKGEHSD